MKYTVVIAALLASTAAYAGNPRPGDEVVTELNKPLTDLLNNGWAIVGGSVTTGFTLTKGHKWMACEMVDPIGEHPTHSSCFALN